jgi:hypothetical protein
MASRKQDDSDYPAGAQDRMQTAYGSEPRRGGYQRQGYGEAAAKSFIRSIAARLGTILVRAITGRLR